MVTMIEGNCSPSTRTALRRPIRSPATSATTTASGTAGNELIKNWTAAQITPSCATKDGQRIVKISAEVPYSPLMWGVVGLPGTITMNVEHEERWIGQ